VLQEQFIKAQRLESLGMLAAGIAHDLNNMLAPIIFSGPLLRNSLTSEKDLKIVTMLENSAERGAALVKQVVAFAQGGGSALRITQIKHLARDVIALAQNTFPKSISVVSQIPADTWPVMANPSQIHQVLLNLCVNARDAMPDGGTLTISLSNRVLTAEEATKLPDAISGNWLVIEVTDTGTGIPPEVLPRIFDAFFTTKAADKGTGLGLNTVRTIVNAHHGFIQVETKLGKGTTMRILLPACSDPEAEATPKARSLLKGNGELILLVDDDSNLRDTLEVLLLQSGYRVMPCADGVEAIVLYQTNSREIDLVITDVDMPNLNGAVLAATLRKLKPDLFIIAVSGLSSSTHIALADAKKHVNTFLHKPFGAMDLLRVMDELLHPRV
jgi:two-component system cell cycle sensor histidine kinase/response regulator CckA